MKRIKMLLAVIAAMAMMIVVAAPAMADTFITSGNEDFDELCCEDEDEDVDYDFLGYAIDGGDLVALYEVEEEDEEVEIEEVEIAEVGDFYYPLGFFPLYLDIDWGW